MTPSLEFFPDAARARLLDARMRDGLADSLSYLAESLGAVDAERAAALSRLAAARHEGGVHSPSAFGLYYDISAELIAGNLSAASSLIDELGESDLFCPTVLEVRALGALPARTSARYQRLMDTDPQMPFAIVSPAAGECDHLRARFLGALSRLEEVAPELADEFRAIVRQVILVEGDPGLGYDFAGGSCYMLWGALFINVGLHASELDLMAALAHEVTHSLLFGFTTDEPLVLNDLNIRYESPLRDDPRTMDGIFHATFVCARMHWAMCRIAGSSSIDPERARQAAERAEYLEDKFKGGLSVVRTHGVLSATGQTLMDGAHRYMLECSN